MKLKLEELKEVAATGDLVGIYDVSNSDYHAGPGTSKSDLDKIDRSPAHYREYKSKPHKGSKALTFGAAFHAMILEPQIFVEQYTYKPDDMDGRSSEGRRWKRENLGKVILTEKEWTDLNGMKKSLDDSEFASLFTGGEAEKSCYWIDRNIGLLIKCRPDYIRRDARVLVDLKTTEDARERAFSRDIAKYRYHVQAAFYLDIVTQIIGEPFEDFIIVAIEKPAPYGIQTYNLDRTAIQQGRMEYQANLRTMAKCLDTDTWPGYEGSIQTIDLPAWEYKKGL